MTLLVMVTLALWFGFQLGRKWDMGERELEQEAAADIGERRGIRLRTITVRR
jgi:hypothetical protein